jgi:hypothetical protein
MVAEGSGGGLTKKKEYQFLPLAGENNRTTDEDSPLLGTSKSLSGQGRGTDAALETAVIALIADDLTKLSSAVDLSRRTLDNGQRIFFMRIFHRDDSGR